MWLYISLWNRIWVKSYPVFLFRITNIFWIGSDIKRWWKRRKNIDKIWKSGASFHSALSLGKWKELIEMKKRFLRFTKIILFLPSESAAWENDLWVRSPILAKWSQHLVTSSWSSTGLNMKRVCLQAMSISPEKEESSISGKIWRSWCLSDRCLWRRNYMNTLIMAKIPFPFPASSDPDPR